MQGFESAPGKNRPPASERAELDRADLARFGYAQRLFRRIGIVSSFGLSFSVLSAFAGVCILFGFGVRLSGPLGLTLGWPLLSVFMLLVAASLGELCSAYPTAGGNYQWASALGSSGWGWFAAWFNLAGLVTAMAGLAQASVSFAVGAFGLTPTGRNIALVAAAVLASQALVNFTGIRAVSVLNGAGVVLQVLGALVLVGLLLAVSRQPVRSLFHLPEASPYAWAFLPGLLVAQWSLLGSDTPAHLAEETVDPRRRGPWAMILSVAVTGVIGYVLLLGLLLTGEETNSIASVAAVLGRTAAGVFAAVAIAVIWFCGLASMASASRTLFALARDRGTPLPQAIQPVARLFGTPTLALALVTGAAGLLCFWRPGLPVLFAFSAVALQAAYLIPIATAWHARRRGSSWPAEAPWSLGSYGPIVNAISAVYLVVASIAVILPPNHLAGVVFLGMIGVLLLVYFLEARRKFAGPAWSRSTHRLPTGPRRP